MSHYVRRVCYYFLFFLMWHTSHFFKCFPIHEILLKPAHIQIFPRRRLDDSLLINISFQDETTAEATFLGLQQATISLIPKEQFHLSFPCIPQVKLYPLPAGYYFSLLDGAPKIMGLLSMLEKFVRALTMVHWINYCSCKCYIVSPAVILMWGSRKECQVFSVLFATTYKVLCSYNSCLPKA